MSRVQTEVSSSLFWHPFTGSVDKEPLFVQYQRYTAQSATSSDLSFYIESPANGVLLDNEVWLYYELSITDTANSAVPDSIVANIGKIRSAWSVSAVEAGDAAIRSKMAANNPNYLTSFRSGLPMQRSCQNCALDINGTVMTYELSKYHDAMNRLYISKEEAPTVFSSSSGGGFDDGNHLGMPTNYNPPKVVGQIGSTALLNPAPVNAAQVQLMVGRRSQYGTNTGTITNVITTYVPDSQFTFNKGFTERANNFEYRWRYHNNVAVDASNVVLPYTRYENTVKMYCYEKLCFSPFHFYDNRDIKMSIPNIRTLQLTFQFHTNQADLMFRSCAAEVGIDMNWWATPPKLLMRWYTPPGGYAIPQQISIPISKMWTYTNATLTQPAAPPGAGYIATNKIVWNTSFSISNISLPAMPDLFILFFKRRLADYKEIMPDDYNLSINKIQIDMEGNSGKLNNADSIQLWNMYRRHLRLYPVGRDEYLHWYNFHCIVPITPSDLGVIKGAGFDNPIQLSLSNIELNYNYGMPSIGNQSNFDDGGGNPFRCPNFNPELLSVGTCNFDMHLICVYDKYALTLTKDGSSELQLLRVNAGGTSTAPSNLGPSSLADISI